MRWRAWLAILVTAVGLYWVGRVHGWAAAGESQIITNAENALHAGDAWRSRLAALRTLERKQTQVALTWQHRADSLRTVAARPVGRDTILRGPDSSGVAIWRDIADAETHSRKACFASLLSCGQRADTAEARVVVLDSLLRGVLQVHQCHVLFIRCPSRFATGVVTGGLGIIMGLWLRHP